MVTLNTETWEMYRDSFRAAVLAAADKAMVDIADQFYQSPDPKSAGAKDEDLPVLFKTLDWQFANNMARLGYTQEAE